MSKDYGSKVDLNDKPEVLRINKVEAADFNDIATDIEGLDQSVFNLATRGAGYWFNGDGDIVTTSITPSTLDLTGDITLEAIINPDGYGGGNSGRIIDNNTLKMYLSAGSKILRFTSASTNLDTPSNSILIDGKYKHCAITRPSDGDNANAYINGELAGDANRDTGTPSAGGNLLIGNRLTTLAAFHGAIPLVRIYNLLLTASEVKTLSAGANLPYKYIGASQATIATGAFIVGKAYRIVTVGDTDFTLIGASTDTIGEEFIATGVGDGTTGEATQIGCVANYSSEGVETNQWKDVSENGNNGDVDGAITINEWNKTESVEYVVSSSKTFTLPKDFIITNIMYENASGSTGDLKIGFGAGTNEIVNQTSIATGTVSSIPATVGKKVNTDDTIYITTTQEMTVKVLMERV